MTSNAGPMHGVRILDLSTIVAGPMAAQILADQGAQVIKVEAPPVGDRARYPGAVRNGVGTTFHMFNRGKRSIVLDLKTAGGVEVLRRLIGESDVLIHNFRPGAMGRLRLDYPSLRETFPQLIYVSISGFGEEGPLADRPAYDHVIQCYAGIAALQADTNPDGAPAFIRNIAVDKLTGLTTAQAITAALFARAMAGGGQEVKLSMLAAAIAFVWSDAAVRQHLVGEGGDVKPGMAEFCRMYRFRNGYATFNPSDASFAALCRLFKSPGGNDPRLQTSGQRVREIELMAEVERQWAEAAAELDVDEGVALLESIDVPCAKVLTLNDLADHPQVQANGILRIVEHPVGGPLREARPPAEFSGTPNGPVGPSPMLGEHSAEILAELGYDAAASVRLRAEGALG
jgi:crotonobetainyl-CoA:carnitine CoA-transferase CaiB-like acyl-CoA transferase